ncbi:MAG: MEKHLA domain-containing protein [Akkermansiaceae bacterium]|nr:MEKHLA domain-containing protein [Akkermansiaceae bacterium]
MSFEEPGPNNNYLANHVALLLGSLKAVTGRDLIDPQAEPLETARKLYEAPFFVASHDTSGDPILTYGNRFAQELFEMSWDEFTSTPSRFTAEAPNREERAKLLAEVTANGFIDNYSGVRISSTGNRFRIKKATVWNLIHPDGSSAGQAATFSNWEKISKANP